MEKTIIAVVLCLCAATSLCAQNLVPYERSGKWGYKSPSGEVVVDAKYAAVSRFADGYGVIYDYNTRLAGLVESSGRVVIEPKYQYIDLCSEGFVAVYICGKDKEMWVDGLWTYIDLSSPDVLFFGDDGYDLVGPFIDSVAWVNCVETKTMRKQRYMPVMDKKGKKEIGRDYLFGVSESFSMEDLYARDDDGNRIVYDGAWVLVDKDKHVRTDMNRPYQMVGEFRDGLAWVKRDGLYGYVNVRGEEVIPVIYTSVQGAPGAGATSLLLRPESGAVRWVMNGRGEMAWLNEKGEVVVDFVKFDGKIPAGVTVLESMWDY